MVVKRLEIDVMDSSAFRGAAQVAAGKLQTLNKVLQINVESTDLKKGKVASTRATKKVRGTRRASR